MNSIKQLDELTLLYGKPINFKDICLIYPATVGDIANIGKPKFYQYLYLLTSDPKALYKLDDDRITTFMFLMLQSKLSPEFNDMIKKAFYFFLHEDIEFIVDVEALQIGPLEQGRMMTSTDYEQFMKFLKRMFKVAEIKEYNPVNDKAKQIAEKLKHGREQVRQIKAKKGNDDNDIDIDTLVSSLGLYYQNIDAVWNLPYYTFFDQVSRMQYKDIYDSNIIYSAAGAKIPKDMKKHWIRKVQDSKGG